MTFLEEISKLEVDWDWYKTLQDSLPNFAAREVIYNEVTVYPYICQYIKNYNIQHFCEVGTREGYLALLTSRLTKVTTFDISYYAWQVGDIDASKNTIKAEEVCNIDFKPFDCIFVDIDHGGDWEPCIHQNLIANYKGLVFWDDIGYNEYGKMNEWWNGLQCDKMMYPWHNGYFGAIQY